MTKRLTPSRQFPPYIFLPGGRNPHPEKEGGYLKEHEIKTIAIDPNDPSKCADYLYAIDLFNYNYYWESHVWWEAIWNMHNREGEIADFLKGLIKLAAGNVLYKVQKIEPAHGHYERAYELLVPIAKKYDQYLLIDLESLMNSIQECCKTHDQVSVLPLY